MGFIKRPDAVKLEDADTPVENEVVCVVEASDDGKLIEIICVPEELLEEVESTKEAKSEIKPRAVITSSSTGEQFGTWIPGLRSTGTIDINVKNAVYTKVGQLVTCMFDITVTNMSGGKKDSPIILSGLPVPDTITGTAFISYFKTSNMDVRQISGTVKNNQVELWCEKRGQPGLVPLTQIDINVNAVLVGTVTCITNS